MELNLSIDIGNSRVKLALFESDEIKHFEVFDLGKESEIIKWLESISFKSGIYSNVLKEDPYWINSILRRHHLIKLNAETPKPLVIQYKTPMTLGSDRIAAMVGAASLCPKTDLLVVNAGSCVTFDLVNSNLEFIGGNIAPGLGMRWKAMHQFTANLPRVQSIDMESGFLGTTTMSALHNGGLQGIVLEIEGYYGRLRQNYRDLKCIITGGTAPYLVNQLKIDNFAEPYLVLKGLNTILKYQ